MIQDRIFFYVPHNYILNGTMPNKKTPMLSHTL